jgi:hypothetical protein
VSRCLDGGWPGGAPRLDVNLLCRTIRARGRLNVFDKTTNYGYGRQLHPREQFMKSLDVVAIAAMSLVAITVMSSAQASSPS